MKPTLQEIGDVARDVEVIPPEKKPKKRMGRPNHYTPEIGVEICNLLARGISLNEICNSGKYPEMPCMTSVYNWLRTEEDFADNYARAKSDSADTLADKIIQVVENSTPETVQVDRLRMDAYRWVAAKLKPKAYGERVDANINAQVKVAAVTLDAAQLAPEARDLLRQSLLQIKSSASDDEG